MSRQVAADLRAAADVLRRDGWTFGAYKDACGLCAMGAIRVTASGRYDMPSARSGRAESVLAAYLGAERVTRWNDEPGRTAEEVIAALLAAADAAEASS